MSDVDHTFAANLENPDFGRSLDSKMKGRPFWGCQEEGKEKQVLLRSCTGVASPVQVFPHLYRRGNTCTANVSSYL
jgi:hypothetical protein